MAARHAMPEQGPPLQLERARAMEGAVPVISQVHEEFAKIFGRKYDPWVEEFMTDGADVVFFLQGGHGVTARYAIRHMRERGAKVGMVRLRTLRPYPTDRVCEVLSRFKVVGVVETNLALGSVGRPRPRFSRRGVLDGDGLDVEGASAAWAEARADQDRRAADADRPLPAAQARALQVRVDLGDARLDRDELGAPLDHERLVEVVAAVHLERQPPEVTQTVLPQEEQRPPLAPQVARRGSGRLAVEEGHGAEVSLPGGRRPVA